MMWATVPLHRVAYLESGFGFPRDYQGDEDQAFPFFRVSDMNIEGNEVFMRHHSNTVSAAVLKELGARVFPAGTVIFPKIGAAIATEKKRILSKPATYDNNVMGAVPKECVTPKFLYYWFLQLKLTDQANPGQVPSIRKSVMEQIPFSLPTPTEQSRIVELLDEADSLRKLRRTANSKFARILPALFLKMFGDPGANPMNWPETTIGAVITGADYGTSTKPFDTVSGLPLIRMGNVNYDGSLTLDELKYVLLSDSEAIRFRLQQGDILFNRTNSKGLVGKTGLWDVDMEAVFASYFIRVRVDSEQVEPTFLWSLMNSSHMKRVLSATARGAIGQANINTTELRAMSVFKPPIELQREFRKRWGVIRAAFPKSADTTDLDNLFSVMLERAFSGQLTAHWRETHRNELPAEMAQQIRTLDLPLPEELELQL
jgi:type I restriction enzyme, S subunit